MKTVATRLIVILMAALFGSGLCWAGNGNGAADGSGPIHDFSDGEQFKYTGTVVDLEECTADKGLCLEVADLAEPVLILGIGPQWYWEEVLGLTRPEVDDKITVAGFTFESDNIATEIWLLDVNNVTVYVDLRDDDGSPLWQSTGSGSGNSADDVELVSAAAMDDDQEAAMKRIQNRMQVLEKVNNMYKKTIRNMTGQLQEVEE
jgi:hypothetical protein